MTFISPETYMRLENEWREMRRGTQILPGSVMKNFARSSAFTPAPGIGGKITSDIPAGLLRCDGTPGKAEA